jgi:NADH dehydrogenase
MDVLVIGGTGFIGQHLCRELDDRGHQVTALSRNPGEADLPESVEGYAGDVTDYESIEAAFEGRDAVVHLVALSPLFKPKGGRDAYQRVIVGGTRNALDAAEEHDVGRFVFMSGLGADPDARTAYLRTKGVAEDEVMASDRDWVVFRPSVVFGDGGEFVSFTKEMKSYFAPGLPFYPFPKGGKTPFQPIWVGDLVPMLAEAVETDAHVGEAYDIGGPEVLTLADVARMAFRADGKTVRIVPVPLALAQVGLTLMGPLPFVPFGPDQGRALKEDNRVRDNGVTAFDVDPPDLRTLADYLGLDEQAPA